MNLDDFDTELNGADLLDEVHDAFTRYVAFPSPEASDAVTLYVAATHGQSAWEHASRLVVQSPIMRCGKTRLLEIVSGLCYRPLRTANTSTAAIVRMIGAAGSDPPTIVADEADQLFRGGKTAKDGVAEDLLGVLNAGYSRNWPYQRWNPHGKDGGELETVSTYAMAVLGWKGTGVPNTIMDRAVVVSMRRRTPGETVAKFRQRHTPELHDIRDRLHAWITPHLDALADTEPDLSGLGLDDRAEDTWEPLIAVADLVSDDWPERARKAAVSLAGQIADDDDPAEQLLADLAAVWDEHEPRLATKEIIKRLCDLEESPWATWHRGEPITPRALAGLLRRYDIRSTQPRGGPDRGVRGYERADLADAWSRYTAGSRSNRSNRATADENASRPGPTNGTDDGTEDDAQSVPPHQSRSDQQFTTDGTDGTDGTKRGDRAEPHPAAKDGIGIGTCIVCRGVMTIIREGQTKHDMCPDLEDEEDLLDGIVDCPRCGIGVSIENTRYGMCPRCAAGEYPCAAPDCTANARRGGAYTCADHMDKETTYQKGSPS